MKKLLLVAMVLALCVGSWAQTQVIDGTTDLTIRFRITMRGLQLTYVVGGTGDDESLMAGCTITPWAVSGADMFLLIGEGMNPCDVFHQVFWVENTGAVVADLIGWHVYTRTASGAADADWVASAALVANATQCVVTEDRYKFSTAFTTSYTAVGHSYGAPHVDMGSHIGEGAAYTFIDGFVAEDPANRGDGTWDNDTDQRTFDIVVTLPSGVTIDAAGLEPDTHDLDLVLRASPTP